MLLEFAEEDETEGERGKDARREEVKERRAAEDESDVASMAADRLEHISECSLIMSSAMRSPQCEQTGSSDMLADVVQTLLQSSTETEGGEEERRPTLWPSCHTLETREQHDGFVWRGFHARERGGACSTPRGFEEVLFVLPARYGLPPRLPRDVFVLAIV